MDSRMSSYRDSESKVRSQTTYPKDSNFQGHRLAITQLELNSGFVRRVRANRKACHRVIADTLYSQDSATREVRQNLAPGIETLAESLAVHMPTIERERWLL